MPDLTIIHLYACKPKAQYNVGGYEQMGIGYENTWPMCTCMSYRFARTGRTNFGGRMVPNKCKHIREAEKLICNFESDHKVNQCPECGGEVEVIRRGV